MDEQTGPAATHTPVLLERVLTLLAPALDDRPAVAVDATLGLGGHAAALLAAHPQLTLVGLDRDAATDALSTFIAGRTLTATQLDFVHLIVTYLTEHGVMDVGRLYEAPFTDHAPAGPESLFSGSDIDALLDVLITIRTTASPGAA